jgi:hypothetical protein
MHRNRDGLLGRIEAGVLDNTLPMSSLLQNCIMLGGHDRARQSANRIVVLEEVASSACHTARHALSKELDDARARQTWLNPAREGPYGTP